MSAISWFAGFAVGVSFCLFSFALYFHEPVAIMFGGMLVGAGAFTVALRDNGK
jgi:hypothetical protein